MCPTRRVLLTGLLAPVVGCAAPTGDSPETYEGSYSWGFEESAFRPCGRDERWWVVDDAELVKRYREVTDREYEPVYAQLRGRLSEPGTYGQQGAYSRELAVTEVLEVRTRHPEDCSRGVAGRN